MIGYHVADFLGALVTVFGTVLPPLIIISIISLFYQSFRDNVIVNMAMVGISLLILALYGQKILPSDLTSMDVTALIIFPFGFVVLRKRRLNPLLIMSGSGIAGIILYFIF